MIWNGSEEIKSSHLSREREGEEREKKEKRGRKRIQNTAQLVIFYVLVNCLVFLLIFSLLLFLQLSFRNYLQTRKKKGTKKNK